MSCQAHDLHNVEDYHAFNFPHFFSTADEINARITKLEVRRCTLKTTGTCVESAC